MIPMVVAHGLMLCQERNGWPIQILGGHYSDQNYILRNLFFNKLGSNINHDLLYSNGSSEYCHGGNILL